MASRITAAGKATVMIMMDAGQVLAQGLEAAETWEGCTPGSPEERAAAETATGALVLLNSYMEAGVPLPIGWVRAQVQASAALPGWSSGAMMAPL
jgi:hypothetical protein